MHGIWGIIRQAEGTWSLWLDLLTAYSLVCVLALAVCIPVESLIALPSSCSFMSLSCKRLPESILILLLMPQPPGTPFEMLGEAQEPHMSFILYACPISISQMLLSLLCLSPMDPGCGSFSVSCWLNGIFSSFSVAVIKCLTKATYRREYLFRLTVCGFDLPWLKSGVWSSWSSCLFLSSAVITGVFPNSWPSDNLFLIKMWVIMASEYQCPLT